MVVDAGTQGVGGQVSAGVGEALLVAVAVGESLLVTVGVGTQVDVGDGGVEVGAGWVGVGACVEVGTGWVAAMVTLGWGVSTGCCTVAAGEVRLGWPEAGVPGAGLTGLAPGLGVVTAAGASVRSEAGRALTPWR